MIEETRKRLALFVHRNPLFRLKYLISNSQIYAAFIIPFTKHNYKVSANFMQAKQKYKRLKTAKRISIFYIRRGKISYTLSLERNNIRPSYHQSGLFLTSLAWIQSQSKAKNMTKLLIYHKILNYLQLIF